MVDLGYSIAIIDVTDITQPLVAKDRAYYSDFEDIQTHIANTKSSLAKLELIRDTADMIVAVFGTLGVTTDNLGVFRWLSPAPGIYLKIHCDSFPGDNRFKNEPTKIPQRIFDILRRALKGQISLSRSFFTRLPLNILRVRPPDYVVYGGTQSKIFNQYRHTKTQEIWAHSFDYDIFRGLRAESFSQTDIAVFIDEYFPYHPDKIALGQRPAIEPDVYFAGLRGFFDQVETELGLKVVIAACPRADYLNMPEVFGGRKIVDGETGRLIRDSRLVLAHRSSAIGMAVMFRRPILIFTFPAAMKHINHRIPTQAIAKALNKPINIITGGSSLSLEHVLEIDKNSYDQMMSKYYKTSDSKDASFWQIVFSSVGFLEEKEELSAPIIRKRVNKDFMFTRSHMK